MVDDEAMIFHARYDAIIQNRFYIKALTAPVDLAECPHRPYHAPLHKYFLPAATTLCLNTGLPIFVSVLENGFIIAFSHISNTSPKNCRIASSVCGLVGLLGMPVLLLEEEEEVPPRVVDGGTEV